MDHHCENAAQRILPGIVEQVLEVLVEGVFYVQQHTSPESTQSKRGKRSPSSGSGDWFPAPTVMQLIRDTLNGADVGAPTATLDSGVQAWNARGVAVWC